jgi:F like protein
MAITAEAIALQEQLDAQLQTVTDTQTRALVAAWVLAWAEVSGDLRDTLEDLLAGGGLVTKTTMSRSLRLRTMLAQITDRLDDLADKARIRITSDLRGVVQDAVDAQRGILNAQLPIDVDTDALDLLDRPAPANRALDAIVKRSTQQITSRTRPLSREAQVVVRRELIRGVAVGSNPRQTAARMVRRAEKGFNGGLTRALNISRTESVDAHRAAAKVGQDQHAKVLAGWVWMCHLSPRTCPSCLVKHGTFHELDEAGPDDHPQGRCSRMLKTKPWEELGFDVEEPDDMVVDARAWFDALPERDQVAIMGRTRLDLLNAGTVTWDELTTRRTTPGWRDSWVMTPISHLLGQSSAGRRAS